MRFSSVYVVPKSGEVIERSMAYGKDYKKHSQSSVNVSRRVLTSFHIWTNGRKQATRLQSDCLTSGFRKILFSDK